MYLAYINTTIFPRSSPSPIFPYCSHSLYLLLFRKWEASRGYQPDVEYQVTVRRMCEYPIEVKRNSPVGKMHLKLRQKYQRQSLSLLLGDPQEDQATLMIHVCIRPSKTHVWSVWWFRIFEQLWAQVSWFCGDSVVSLIPLAAQILLPPLKQDSHASHNVWLWNSASISIHGWVKPL